MREEVTVMKAYREKIVSGENIKRNSRKPYCEDNGEGVMKESGILWRISSISENNK